MILDAFDGVSLVSGATESLDDRSVDDTTSELTLPVDKLLSVITDSFSSLMAISESFSSILFLLGEVELSAKTSSFDLLVLLLPAMRCMRSSICV